MKGVNLKISYTQLKKTLPFAQTQTAPKDPSAYYPDLTELLVCAPLL